MAKRYQTTFRTFSHCLNIAVEMEEMSKKADASNLYLQSACLFGLFAVEGAANHVGPELFGKSDWNSIETGSSLRAKLAILGYIADIGKVDFAKRPYQSIAEAVTFRNWIVHPKTRSFEHEKFEQGDPKVMAKINASFTSTFMEDCKWVINKLLIAANEEPWLELIAETEHLKPELE